jgi:hypothetical protein
LLRHKLVQWIRHDEIVRPQTRHGRGSFFRNALTSSALSRRTSSSAASAPVFAAVAPRAANARSDSAAKGTWIFMCEFSSTVPAKVQLQSHMPLAKSRIWFLF